MPETNMINIHIPGRSLEQRRGVCLEEALHLFDAFDWAGNFARYEELASSGLQAAKPELDFLILKRRWRNGRIFGLSADGPTAVLPMVTCDLPHFLSYPLERQASYPVSLAVARKALEEFWPLSGDQLRDWVKLQPWFKD
jgi:hypothetical protein